MWWSNSRLSFWNNLQPIPPSSMNPYIDHLVNRCNNMEKMIRWTLELLFFHNHFFIFFSFLFLNHLALSKANLLEESTGAKHHWLFKLQLFSQLLMMKIMLVIIVMIIIIFSCNYWNRMGDMELHIFSPLKVCVWRERLGLCAGQVEPQKRRIFFARSLSLSEFNLDEIKKKHDTRKKEGKSIISDYK